MTQKKQPNYFLHISLILVGLVFIFPFIWMILSSFKSAADVFNLGVFLPRKWQFDNYLEVFRYQPFGRQYLNSLYITILVTSGVIIIGSLSGYAFARITFPGRNLLFLMILSGLMIPVEVSIIPNFFFMKSLGLTNTHVPLIIIPILGSQGAFATFMMRQFFLSIPKELEEAARIDGLTPFGIFSRIFLPLSGSALSTVAILKFLFTWNDYLEPLVYINDLKLFTIPLALTNFSDSYGLPMEHLQLAATSMSLIPILTVYLLAQDKITNSMAGSGMKG